MYNRIIFLFGLFIVVGLVSCCTIYLSQLTNAQKGDTIKTAQVLLEDANDTIKNTNDTDKAITYSNLALEQLRNVTNYNNSVSDQTASVL